jgi:hypothetical protein
MNIDRLWRAFGAMLVVGAANADAVTDWNQRAVDYVVASGLTNQPAHRVLAISHTAAFEAAQAAASRGTTPRTSIEVAIIAAHCTALARLLPTQQAPIDTACRAALDALPSGAGKDAGVAAGEHAANDVLARRADDGSAAPDTYRPFTTAGRYVPTLLPASPQWGQRKPWLMTSPSQFRPGPPPALDGDQWARELAEVKAMGGARSTQRSAEQTEVARFWETSHPMIYHALVRSVADRPGRDLVRNARLFAAFTQAIDDTMIALFDAKYHYAFWRPITAIRNADLDGNDATERDGGWSPLIPTPMHPEYPCAHCGQAGVVHAVLGADLRAEASSAPPVLATSSPSARGAVRRYTSLDALVQEVAAARIHDGVHFRFSTEAGTELGQRVGALAVRRFAGH